MKLKRAFYLAKCRARVLTYNLIERVLLTLSNLGLIVKYKKTYSNVLHEGDIHSAPDIKTNRFVFNVSYIIRKIEFVSQYWFETKRGRRIYTVYDTHHVETRLSFRAGLESFFCHFSHKHRMWVYSHSPTVVITKVPHICSSFIEPEMVKFENRTCDFSQCRFAFEISLTPNTNTCSEEVISESCRVLENRLTSKIPEINKILTGAENDGNLTSPSNCPLCDNLVCRECGYPVFATNSGKHTYECIHHGEIDHYKVERVNPIRYETILSNCLFELERFCECP